MNAPQPVLPGMPAAPAAAGAIREDWVLRKPCGCATGVAVLSSYPTEDKAWRAFYDSWRQVAKAMQAGYRLERFEHERYRTEVMPQLMSGWECPHGGDA